MGSRGLTYLNLAILAAAIGCGDDELDPLSPDATTDAGTVQTGDGGGNFGRDASVGDAGFITCDDLVTSAGARCTDFNDGTAPGWVPEGGNWGVSGGAYTGEVPSLSGSSCGVSLMMTSMFREITARDVRVELDMMSNIRVDKVIVLRGIDPSNRIELNFRAKYVEESDGDLVVQELVDCEQIQYTPEYQIDVPHQIGQAIHAEIRLVGDMLSVWIDDELILMDSYPFADRAGNVGIGLIEGGTATFDNIIIESLDGLQP